MLDVLVRRVFSQRRPIWNTSFNPLKKKQLYKYYNPLEMEEANKPRPLYEAWKEATKPLYEVCTDVASLRRARRQSLFQGQTLGFVPTMGALHEGHLSLVRQAAAENNHVCVSIYVNPTQFGVNEDLSSYPRTWNADLAKLDALCHELRRDASMGQITTVFAPKSSEMYPNLPPSSEIEGHGSFVNISPLSSILEGASRPVFFRGVATVVMKLLNIVQPERVYFGQKDIQQTYVVRRMVEDFHLDTLVRVGPTVREEDGLALAHAMFTLGLEDVMWLLFC